MERGQREEWYYNTGDIHRLDLQTYKQITVSRLGIQKVCGFYRRRIRSVCHEATSKTVSVSRVLQCIMPPSQCRRLPADGRVLQLSRVLWNPPAGETSLVGPVVRVLRLPCPLDPSCGALLECDDLCLPVLTKEGLVARAERGSTTGKARAAANLGRARVRPVVARADTTAVQVLCTVRGSGGPFANDDPEIEAGERRRLGAGGGDVLLVRP